jgi:hypothetical protein
MQQEKLHALEKSLADYYAADPAREAALRRILDHEAGFSLREIDWFVTNMAAREPQIFRNPKTGRIVDVGGDYKDTLRCYHKAAFDSFRRKPTSSSSSTAQADVKQRNFFRWALETGVVDHVAENIDAIKEDMAREKRTFDAVGKRSPSPSATPSGRRKKQRLGVASTFSIVVQPHEIRIAPPAHVNIEW